MEWFFSNPTSVFWLNLVIVILFLFLLFVLVYKGTKRITEIVKIDFIEGLIILGATLIIFSSSVESFFNAIYKFIIYPFNKDTNGNILAHAIQSVEQGKTTIKFDEIILFCLSAFTFWILAIWFYAQIKFYVQKKLKENAQKDFFEQHMTKTFLITIFFSTALFLVISTIVAVPEFQSIETGLDVDELEQEFNNELNERNGTISLITSRDLSINFNNSRDSINNNTDNKPSVNNSQIESLKLLTLKYNLLVERAITYHESLRINMENHYITEVSKGMSERNRKFYRSQLINLGLGQTQKIAQELKATKSALLSSFAIDNQSFGKNELNLLKTEVERDLQRIDSLIRKNRFQNVDTSTSLGIFGFMSRWLLNTRSLSLALIVGMFGFGLLGAISSSFIRTNIRTGSENETTGSEKDKKWVTLADQVIENLDLRSVLITGITAAIVIFLSVKGALVVLTASENETNINPYILFFICFAAALYNEEVWQWVVKKFRGYIGEQADSKKIGDQQKASLLPNQNPTEANAPNPVQPTPSTDTYNSEELPLPKNGV